MSWDNGTKASTCSLYWSIDEGQLSDVVLVDHSEDWLLLLDMDLGVLEPLLVHGQQLPEAVVWDQTEGFLLWLAVDGVQWGWQSTGGQTVDGGLFATFLDEKK